MQQRAPAISPRLKARVAGALYLLVILLGAFAEIGIRQGMVTAGDPAATARTIMAHQHLFRLRFAAEMMTNVIAVPVTLIMYRLLAPTSRSWMLLAVVLDLTQNTINAVNAWTQFAPLTLLSGSPDLAAIPQAELSALARLALKWHDVGFDIGLTFFGFALLIEGALIFRYTFPGSSALSTPWPTPVTWPTATPTSWRPACSLPSSSIRASSARAPSPCGCSSSA